MSYELRIWDPTRHGPAPASADEALDTMERLAEVNDTRNPALEKFGAALVHFHQEHTANTPEAGAPGAAAVYWGGDQRAQTTACRTAIYPLSLPSEDQTQIVVAVEAASRQGLALFDDETGMCFLPDGTVYPEDSREMWESTLADVKAGPPDPTKVTPDNRTLLQTIASALWDELGRGNKRL